MNNKKCYSSQLYHLNKEREMQNFKSKDDLQKLIELLRCRLEMLYYKEGSFVHPAVLQLSQRLDEYIVMFEKIRH
ncbi:hypothetical protein J5TS2_04710 [Brevibacillus halotolerans]|nr:hypothetical protein J5TS2_04710 [Brevibacillus halotolerans]